MPRQFTTLDLAERVASRRGIPHCGFCDGDHRSEDCEAASFVCDIVENGLVTCDEPGPKVARRTNRTHAFGDTDWDPPEG